MTHMVRENGHQCRAIHVTYTIQLFIRRYKCTLEDGLQFTCFSTILECGTRDRRTWCIGTWGKNSTYGCMTLILTPPRSGPLLRTSSYVVSTRSSPHIIHVQE
ncbi:hypothetical protein Salat_0864400 [Sesamum alatum]|uniref:Uncharacterized protein n=1 Tax=Sesamum alatum TaxID=300844 RepID=A0AAE1YIR5_9LAMI|nr:hypothetical protein Salat_0864400 [Sesamum alatum]